MRVIVGLGNPGMEYQNTRHNAGFDVIDLICQELGVTLDKTKFKALYTTVFKNGKKAILVKPLTYMNLSGEAVKPLLNYFEAEASDLIVIHDDLDLPIGKLRLREKGSSGGQKGMGNIIDLLGTKDICRIRVGIANNKQIDTKDYVLGKVAKDDRPMYEESLKKAKDAAIFAIDHDFSLTMNHFN